MPVARRTGFTLIETLMVIVVISLAGLIALPKFRDGQSQSNLRSATHKVVSLYSAARSNSMASGRPTYLHLADNLVYVTASPRRKAPIGANVQDTLTAAENIYTQYGVSVVGSADSILINRNGLGTAATIRLIKGSRADTLTISPYGQVDK
jgi:prepilin-type N-terminal cleavage/methylation domain-containing protein